MSIFVNEDTNLLIQGITGREASEKVPEMIEYGTNVVAGVTPGKKGETVAGVPVYNTVKEAKKQHPEINASLIYVPPFAAKEASIEALKNSINFLNIVTERIPVKDTHEIINEAEKHGAHVIGPTSVGIISPGKSKVGPIGGSSPDKVYKEGRIGIISKSGGMTTETAWVIRQAGYGVSTAIGLGGDRMLGTTFVDALEFFEKDDQTEAVVMFGELGGKYENNAAKILGGSYTKPLIAFIAGEFTEKLPKRNYGHAGAIIRDKKETPSYKKQLLRDNGAEVVEVHHEIGEKLKKIID